MVEPYPPRRLPPSFVSIAIATAIALSGYLLFIVRYRNSVRRVEQATHEHRQAVASMPVLVAHEVRQAVESGAVLVGADEQTIDRLASLETQVAELKLGLQRAELSASTARREAELLRLGAGGQVAPAPAPAPAAAVTAVGVEQPEVGSGGAAGLPAFVGGVPPDAVVTDRRAGLRFTLVRARITGRGVELDLTVTKESGGDGFVRLSAPNDTTSCEGRIVTVDGVEYDKGSVGTPTDRTLGRRTSAKLIEGVPMRFVVLYHGKFDRAMVCRRIEIDAYNTSDSHDRFLVKFENIPVLVE